MNFTTGYILTKAGEALQAKAESGTELKLTKMQLGSGTTVSVDDYYERTALIEPKNAMSISEIKQVTTEKNLCVVIAVLTNAAVDTSYTASELGLFAQDTDGTEILYAVSYDSNPTYIASKDDGTDITMKFYMYIVSTSDINITLTLPKTAEEIAAVAAGYAAKAAESEAKAKQLEATANDYLQTTQQAMIIADGYANLSKAWAEGNASPDGVVDTNSPTGYTQSAKIWAALSKEYAGLNKFKLPIGYYNSVDEMRASETAIVGRPCVTLGYYELNDGGGGVYTIRQKKESDEDDGGSILVLDNGNVAELLIDGAVTVKQFGAKGDGTADDTAAIQHALDKSDNVIVPAGTYLVNAVTNLKLTDRKNMHITIMAGAEIKAITTDASHYYVFALLRCNNVVIDGGGTITGDTDTHTGTDGEWGYGIQIYHCTNIVVKDLEIQKMWGDGVYIGDYTDGQQCENITVRDCYIHNNRRQGISICYAAGVLVDNCRITDISGTSPQAGIDIELEGSATTLVAQSDIHIKNTKITNCTGSSVQIFGDATGIVITDCIADGELALVKDNAGSVEICNSKFDKLVISTATTPDTIIRDCSINGIAVTNTLRAYNCTINTLTLLGTCYMQTGELVRLEKGNTDTTGKLYANGICFGDDAKGGFNINSTASFVFTNSKIKATAWDWWDVKFDTGIIDNCDVEFHKLQCTSYNELKFVNSTVTYAAKTNDTMALIDLESKTGTTVFNNNILDFDAATSNASNVGMTIIYNDATIINNLVKIKNKALSQQMVDF